jgi:hypothetical protein
VVIEFPTKPQIEACPLHNEILKARIESHFSALFSAGMVVWRPVAALPASSYQRLLLYDRDDGYGYAALLPPRRPSAVETYFVARRRVEDLEERGSEQIAGPFILPPIEPPAAKSGTPVPAQIGVVEPSGKEPLGLPVRLPIRLPGMPIEPPSPQFPPARFPGLPIEKPGRAAMMSLHRGFAPSVGAAFAA